MNPKLILYVDDEEDERRLVESLLRAAGYEVRTAASVSEAQSILRSRLPDLVITDVIMPGESGYSLCTRMKADPATHDIPLVVLTVLEDERKALAAGATAFLSKPIERPALYATVAELLRPTDAKGKLDAALADLRAGKIATARSGLEEVLRIDREGPLAKWAHYFLGQIEHQDGNLTPAADHFIAILERDPLFWRAHNRLAMIYEAGRHEGLAAKHYQLSLTLNENQPDVWNRMKSLGLAFRPS